MAHNPSFHKLYVWDIPATMCIVLSMILIACCKTKQEESVDHALYGSFSQACRPKDGRDVEKGNDDSALPESPEPPVWEDWISEKAENEYSEANVLNEPDEEVWQ